MLCVYVCICVYECVCGCEYMRVYMCVCNVYVCLCTYLCVRKCIQRCVSLCVMCGCTHVYVGETLSCLPSSHDLPITAPALRVVVKQTQAPLTGGIKGAHADDVEFLLTPDSELWRECRLGPENSRAQMVRPGSGYPVLRPALTVHPRLKCPQKCRWGVRLWPRVSSLISSSPPTCPGPHARLPGAPGALLGGPRCRGRGACAFSWS